MKFKITLFSLIFLVNTCIYCQTVLVGQISDITGEPLVGAAVLIKGTQEGGVADKQGIYRFETSYSGDQEILVSYIGYQVENQAVHILKNRINQINMVLTSSNKALKEVVVQSKSNAQIKREQPIKMEVIDVKQIQERSVSLPQLINQTSGVKVRQNGGVGSTTTININGLQGNAIRFFRDGIPMDYLGRAFNLSLLPVDQISNIEIYKGVLPVKLGSDALGGAVNIISNQDDGNRLNVSYSYGSFNTHLATLNAHYIIPKTKVFVSASSYFVYSDNNYKVKVDIADEQTGNLKETEVERFHGGVKSVFGEIKTGLKGAKIADLLEFGIDFSDIDKEIQNDFRMQNVFGEVMYYEDAKIITTHYKKSIYNLAIDGFGAYSNLNSLYDDTPDNSYDWFGNATPYEDEDHVGESSDDVQSYRKLTFDHVVFRLNLNYIINDHNQLNFNHNYIYKKRVGSDPYAQTSSYGVDGLTIPAKYIRNISGLGLTSTLFNNQITNVFTLKRYQVYTRSVATSYNFYGDVSEVRDLNYGIGNSLKYSQTDNRYIRLSYEKATRIPTTAEYLGDSERDISGNPDLLSERSDNVNLGVYSNLNRSNTLWADINMFYRYVQDNIVLKTYTLIQSRYENSDNTRVFGSELSLKSNPVSGLNLNLSVTYQDIRRKKVLDISDVLLEDARRANIPYFFGNFGVRYSPDKIWLMGNWQFYGNYAYVEQYLLNEIQKSEEPMLFGKANSDNNIIPTQNIVDVGLTYRNKILPLRINLEVNNVFNTEAYDGFRVQKPGRNCRIKLKYTIN